MGKACANWPIVRFWLWFFLNIPFYTFVTDLLPSSLLYFLSRSSLIQIGNVSLASISLWRLSYQVNISLQWNEAWYCYLKMTMSLNKLYTHKFILRFSTEAAPVSIVVAKSCGIAPEISVTLISSNGPSAGRVNGYKLASSQVLAAVALVPDDLLPYRASCTSGRKMLQCLLGWRALTNLLALMPWNES